MNNLICLSREVEIRSSIAIKSSFPARINANLSKRRAESQVLRTQINMIKDLCPSPAD